jgi:hypothetical protein
LRGRFTTTGNKSLHRLPDCVAVSGDDPNSGRGQSFGGIRTTSAGENNRDTPFDQQTRCLDSSAGTTFRMDVLDRLVNGNLRIRNDEAGTPSEPVVHRGVE